MQDKIVFFIFRPNHFVFSAVKNINFDKPVSLYPAGKNELFLEDIDQRILLLTHPLRIKRNFSNLSIRLFAT